MLGIDAEVKRTVTSTGRIRTDWPWNNHSCRLNTRKRIKRNKYW